MDNYYTAYNLCNSSDSIPIINEDELIELNKQQTENLDENIIRNFNGYNIVKRAIIKNGSNSIDLTDNILFKNGSTHFADFFKLCCTKDIYIYYKKENINCIIFTLLNENEIFIYPKHENKIDDINKILEDKEIQKLSKSINKDHILILKYNFDEKDINCKIDLLSYAYKNSRNEFYFNNISNTNSFSSNLRYDYCKVICEYNSFYINGNNLNMILNFRYKMEENADIESFLITTELTYNSKESPYFLFDRNFLLNII